MAGANIFTPGPINIFVRFRASPGVYESSTHYLGTCIQAPEPEADYFNLPVYNDLAGRSVPFQIVQDGEKHTIILIMNRFDLLVARRIRNLKSGGPLPVGTESGLARGTLVIGLQDFELNLVNSYAGTPAAGTTPADLPPGRRYYSANLLKYKESTIGSRVLEVALAVECLPVFNPKTRGFHTYEETSVATGQVT